MYAIALGKPADGHLRIQALRRPSGTGGNQIDGVQLLGYNGKVPFQQTAEALVVTLPAQSLSPIACAVKIVDRICARPLESAAGHKPGAARKGRPCRPVKV